MQNETESSSGWAGGGFSSVVVVPHQTFVAGDRVAVPFKMKDATDCPLGTVTAGGLDKDGLQEVVLDGQESTPVYCHPGLLTRV